MVSGVGLCDDLFFCGMESGGVGGDSWFVDLGADFVWLVVVYVWVIVFLWYVVGNVVFVVGYDVYLLCGFGCGGNVLLIGIDGWCVGILDG